MTEHRVETLGSNGDGCIETIQGRVFAPFTLPGEKISGQIENGRIAEPKILAPSPERIKAPCRHFRQCGGCNLQHASDPFVADWKQNHVRKALETVEIETDFRPLIDVAIKSRRRASFTARRGKSGVAIGFLAHRSDQLVPLEQCEILEPKLFDLLPVLKEVLRFGLSRKGTAKCQVNACDNGMDVDVTGVKDIHPSEMSKIAALCEPSSVTRLSWNGEVMFQKARPVLRFGQGQVHPPVGAFLQASTEAEAAIWSSVQDVLGQARVITELFCGCGTFTFRAAEGAKIRAYEGDRGLVQALQEGANQARGLQRIEASCRDLFRNPLLAAELAHSEAILIDPPRAGALAQCTEIANSNVAKIAFVSCDATTFARDARILTMGGYHLDWVQVIDQFRWTPHVEIVGQFTRG